MLRSRQFKVKRRPKVNRSDLPSVSLLRPLKDLEPGLEENLTACFSMDYPKFEILISVADMDDPAAALARKVAKRFPKVDCQILQGNKC